MFLLNQPGRKNFRILIAIVIISGIINMLSAPAKVSLKNFVLDGQNQIKVKNFDSDKIEIKEIISKGKFKPDAVIINKANLEQLLCCPGIGNKKAEQIIQERKIKLFTDWRDFQDRISGISHAQIDILKSAGVKLDETPNQNYEEH